MSLHGLYKQGHEALLAQVRGSLKTTRGLQLAVSGDLRHSVAGLVIVPPVLGLDAALGQSDTFIEGRELLENINYYMTTQDFNMKNNLSAWTFSFLM